MRIETVIDLANRDRLLPPPLNILIYPIGFAIHLLILIVSLISCNNNKCICNLNIYSKISRKTYLLLENCYCGCHRNRTGKFRDIWFDRNKKYSITDASNDEIIQKSLYKGTWFALGHLTGFTFIKNKISYQCEKRGCNINCKREQKQQRKKQSQKRKKQRIEKKYKEQPFNAYHKGCYNCIKLRVKDDLGDSSGKNETTTVRGITMKEYISKFEKVQKTKLHLDDTILLKHLTVDTLFCNYCYQPFLEHQVDKILLTPFRVLLDLLSCIVFLFTAWIPLLIFFTIMSIFQYLFECCADNVKSKKSNQGNKYIEFDREYYPHPQKQVVQL